MVDFFKKLFLCIFSSFKIQLLFYFCIMSIIPSAIIWVYFYNSSNNMIEDSIKDSNLKIVNQIVENMEERVNEVNTFIESIYFNDSLINILKSGKQTELINTKAEEIAIRKDIDYKFVYFPVTKYIQSILIIGDNGTSLSYGPDSKAYDPNVLYNENWFKACMESNDGRTMWNGLNNNYSRTSSIKNIIPLVKIIKDKYSNKKLGVIVIMFSDKIFNNLYDRILQNDESNIYIVNEKGSIISTNDDISGIGAVEEKMLRLTKDKDNHYLFMTDNNMEYMVISSEFPKQTWWAFEVIKLDYIQQQKTNNLKTTLLLVVIIFSSSVLFSVFLSQNFANPVKRLVERVNLVAAGNFSQTIQISNRNELGILSQHINKMVLDIQNLIQQCIAEEKEKREIEIKMLQSQINPHFLYNTLNIIKWMAAVQGNNSIRDIVLSLGALLKEAYEGVDEKIRLEDEIAIINHYIQIQRVKYKGRIKFSINVSDENLMKATIVKFTLQPLIENAIFHGIEPKQGMGEIIVYVREENNRLIITIKDNGLGMSQERISQVMIDEQPAHNKHHKGIGLANVERRIRLFYGNEYGMRIESEEGKYTSITLILPLEFSN